LSSVVGYLGIIELVSKSTVMGVDLHEMLVTVNSFLFIQWDGSSLPTYSRLCPSSGAWYTKSLGSFNYPIQTGVLFIGTLMGRTVTRRVIELMSV